MAKAYLEELKRQVARLESQVDRLQGDLRIERDRFSEDLRRKDILLQGAQGQVMQLSDRMRLLAAPGSTASTSASSQGGTTLAPRAMSRQHSGARKVADGRSVGVRENLVRVHGWPTLSVVSGARRVNGGAKT